jgi:hypothetical protein
MKYQVTPQQITNELYNIFSDDRRAVQYMTGTGEQYTGLLGWAGVMSPENRAAFIKAFGVSVVLECEQEARARVAEYRAAVDRSTYHRNEMAADAFEASGEVPAVGSFVWGRWSCLKGEGGPLGELEDLERMDQEGRENPRRLCEVVAVVDASPAEFLAQDFADGVARQFQDMGGSRYDESDPARLDGVPYSWELVFCVRCADRWYFIDGQGYDYTRYLLFPCDFRAMYREELAGITAAREAQEQAAKEAARMEAERRRAEYLERCAKWAPYMTDATEAQAAYDATPWRDRKAHAAALRKLGSIRRGNISAMIRAAFPSLKFSVKKWDGWGGAYEVTYIDGPTEAEFTAALDLDLFAAIVDTFDGMTDCEGVERMEFTDFSAKYMGNMYGGVNVSREMSDEARAELVDILASIAPAARDCKGYDAVTLSVSEMNQYAKMTGADMSAFYHSAHGNHEYRDTPAAFARRAWFERSYMTAAPVPSPTDPTGTDGQGAKGETTEGTPSEGSTGAAYGTCEKSPISEKPAAGLQLVDIAGGGVAVTGDSRATYKARKEIKSHGATWNKAAKQWEAHSPEAVAALREWFGVTVQDATPEASAPVDELPAPPALVSYDPAEPVERAEFHTSEEVAPTAPTEGSHPATEDTPTDDPTPSDGATGAAYGTCEKSPVPESLAALYEKAKTKRPDAVALFRCCNWFTAYGEDADKVAQAVGIIVTVNREGYRLASFPAVALDTYLPRMIRQGLTVCICEVPPTPPTRPTDPTGTDGSHPATEETPTEDPAPSDGATGAAYGLAEKSPISEEVPVSVPDVKEYKLMYLFGAWVCHSRVYAETDAEAIQDATDDYITSRLPRWAYRVALWEGSRLVHVFKEDGPDDIGRRDMEQEEREDAPAYIVRDTTEGPFRFDDCATGSILAAVDRVANNEHMANPHPLQLFADGVKVWDREEHPTEYLAHIVRQRLAL